jgi:hypothetical protein
MIIKKNKCDLIIVIIVIIFIIFIIIDKLFFYNKDLENFDNNYNNNGLLSNNKPIIWNYWETPIGKKKPGYIDLCHQSALHNCSNCFTIISLNEHNIKNYLPNIEQYNLKNLAIPQKVDFYRYLLLEKYGGLWIDADIIILKCLCPYYKKLKNHDYVGFGCGFDKKTCKKSMDGYSRPLNWMMASRPNTDFMKCIKDNAIEKIENQNKIEYHGIGKDILAKCHDKLKKEKNWSYYHVGSKCQEYDSFGNKLNRIFTNFNNTDCSDRYFFPFYNTSPGLPDWFKELSADELKNSTLNINHIIKEAFSKKEKCNKYT